ncbi:MAG TPA: hypothetical protein VLN59_08830, partial [Burkholderiales bacterium]|nr:hypothetical protein [Burkholderiales bacterium]
SLVGKGTDILGAHEQAIALILSILPGSITYLGRAVMRTVTGTRELTMRRPAQFRRVVAVFKG